MQHWVVFLFLLQILLIPEEKEDIIDKADKEVAKAEAAVHGWCYH